MVSFVFNILQTKIWDFLEFSFFPDLSTTYDLEFPRRTNEDYVLLELPAFPALAAFTVTFFVSFTDPGDKTFISYFAIGAMNEIFIHERDKQFKVWIKKVARLVFTAFKCQRLLSINTTQQHREPGV